MEMNVVLKIVTCVHICVFLMCLRLLVGVRMCVEAQAFTGGLFRELSLQMETGSPSLSQLHLVLPVWSLCPAGLLCGSLPPLCVVSQAGLCADLVFVWWLLGIQTAVLILA